MNHRLHLNTHVSVLHFTQKAVCDQSVRILSRHLTEVEQYSDDLQHLEHVNTPHCGTLHIPMIQQELLSDQRKRNGKSNVKPVDAVSKGCDSTKGSVYTLLLSQGHFLFIFFHIFMAYMLYVMCEHQDQPTGMIAAEYVRI